MAVIGRNSRVIENTGRNVDVKPFTSDCKTLENVPIVDAVLKWYDEHNDNVDFVHLLESAAYDQLHYGECGEFKLLQVVLSGSFS